MDDLDPSGYLFEDPHTEPAPTAWFETVMALPVREDHGLVMG